MQYVQSLPPVYTPTSPTDTVAEPEAVPAVRPVAPQPSTTLVRRYLDARLPALEQRWTPRPVEVESERRKVCRRIHQEAVLEELRAGTDRRRPNQRSSDLTTAVDEKI